MSSVLLNARTPILLKKLRQLPELGDVTSDQEPSAVALSTEIKRETTYHFGIGANAINRVLYHVFGQRQNTQFYAEVSQNTVIIEAQPALQADV